MRRTILFIVLGLGLLLLLGLGWYLFVDKKPSQTAATLPLVTTSDHILGDPAAPIVLVEYCDIDSPYCKSFQTVMEGVIATYGKTGQVAWVYRHFPLTDQYANADTVAEASECIAAQGGTNAFFKFIDDVNTVDVSTLTDASSYTPFTSSLGIDANTFSTCVSGGTYQPLVEGQAHDALNAGATGAPYTVVFIHGAPSIPIQGAFSYGQMQQLIDTLLAKEKGS
ncbi:MAG TPA: thioredoxin domain-containing protein [Candidatus Paceibacterota bacterium]|nr:thioredoxin domain-containing protein [Candidatus Paceibacterota bacterium]